MAIFGHFFQAPIDHLFSNILPPRADKICPNILFSNILPPRADKTCPNILLSVRNKILHNKHSSTLDKAIYKKFPIYKHFDIFVILLIYLINICK